MRQNRVQLDMINRPYRRLSARSGLLFRTALFATYLSALCRTHHGES